VKKLLLSLEVIPVAMVFIMEHSSPQTFRAEHQGPGGVIYASPCPTQSGSVLREGFGPRHEHMFEKPRVCIDCDSQVCIKHIA